MKKLIILAILIVLCASGFSTCALAFADSYTAVAGATDVMEDLQNDEDIDVNDWPMDNTNVNLEVITIAEGTDKALYVYVYQPSVNREPLATSVNICLSKQDGERTFNNYPLTFINGNGVFAKYVVNNLVVSNATSRYYEISSIYRSFIDGVDTAPNIAGATNTVSEVACAVGGAWTFDDNGLTYNEIETITITSQYVGFVRYPTDRPLNPFGYSLIL